MAIGNDQAAFTRQDVLREIGGDAEKEAIAEIAVIPPFAVGREIGATALDFDDDDLALLVDRHQIGAATIGQGELAQRRQTQIAEQEGNAAVQPLRRVVHAGTSRSPVSSLCHSR